MKSHTMKQQKYLLLNKQNPLLSFKKRCSLDNPWWVNWTNTHIEKGEYPDERVADAYSFVHKEKLTISSILNYISSTCNSEDRWEYFLHIVYFVQDNITHVPVLEPYYNALYNLDGTLNTRWQLQDPLALLVLGEGRCFVTSLVLIELLTYANYDAEILQLDNHVVTQINIDSKSYIIDADAFKNGILFFKDKNTLYTKEEILKNPSIIDNFEPSGWKFKRKSHFMKNNSGEFFSGFVDPYDKEIDGLISKKYMLKG
ncbi:MAG: hypothetical protein PHW89_08550 [Sulfurimonas denitrificans]|nr:hypothetical protein [Sulfurimonas denitrificans]